MKLQEGYFFEHSFRKLPPILFEDVTPTPLLDPKLIHTTSFISDLGLNHLSGEQLLMWLNGQSRMEGDTRMATRYAGHQFGVWAGQLGDGRAISLGEIVTPDQSRFEIQTKGSGLTPFSRMGDGKAVIRSSVREYLASEAMHGLGIPTTRVLALLTGEDKVRRESVERSAIVARVFPSNIRFGHFEMCYHFEHKEALKELTRYTREHLFQMESTEDMLRALVARTATLMASWQDVGFCHGVMNTDNMSILGLTLDYGPFGFLEDTILNYICNHTDHRGRYAYQQQPSVAMWNLERLLVCFSDELPRPKLEEILRSFVPTFETAYARLCRQKMGLLSELPQDFALFIDLLKTMATLNVDYTFFFRCLARYEKGKISSLKPIWDYYGNREEILSWLKRYDERLGLEVPTDSERSQKMLANNPKYVLKNYIAQEIIQDVEAGGVQKLQDWLKVFYRPFDEHEDFESYSRPTPPALKNMEVSCSS
jgi:uncharacterized protein YdiU (UPF0061 family)